MCDRYQTRTRARTQADATYRGVLKRYPRSALVLRAYAAFLEEVSREEGRVMLF